MRSLSSTTASFGGSGRVLIVMAVCAVFAVHARAADLRIAVLTPDGTEKSRTFAADLSSSMAGSAKVLDDLLTDAAYRAVAPTTPFNMTADESRNLGSAIGCDFFIVVRSDDQRRSSSARAEYYESYAAVFAVSARTGRLVDWSNSSFERPLRKDSADALKRSIPAFAVGLIKRLNAASAAEAAEAKPPTIDEMPADASPAAKEYRAPIPYKRIKPEYTTTAFLYEIAATVEIELDLDADGNITRTEITRWAGFGLDESVIAAVRAMNWRPAERSGKPLPMRVLLRYNFKKIDK